MHTANQKRRQRELEIRAARRRAAKAIIDARKGAAPPSVLLQTLEHLLFTISTDKQLTQLEDEFPTLQPWQPSLFPPQAQEVGAAK